MYTIKARNWKHDEPTVRKEKTLQGLMEQMDYFLDIGYTVEVTFQDDEEDKLNNLLDHYKNLGHKVEKSNTDEA